MAVKNFCGEWKSKENAGYSSWVLSDSGIINVVIWKPNRISENRN
jgi:hypothetical protein